MSAPVSTADETLNKSWRVGRGLEGLQEGRGGRVTIVNTSARVRLSAAPSSWEVCLHFDFPPFHKHLFRVFPPHQETAF